MSKAAELAALIGGQTAQSNKNLIINGAATVHQRGNTTATSSASTYFVDRWVVYHNTAAAANLQQSTVVPSGQGFSKSILVDCTTADTSVASSDTFVLRQIIEGQNLQRLAYGTSDAKSITLSFWVRSTKTGTYICNIYHADATARSQSQQYTISQSDTWEYKTLTFSGDTSIAADDDNAATFYVQWGLMVGSDLSSGTLNTTWQNSTDANRFVGQVNFFDSTSNNFYLTGVQLEVGDVATAFEHEDFGTTLSKCQRYLYRRRLKQYDVLAMGHSIGTNLGRYLIHLPVSMRIRPSVSDGGDIACWYNNGGALTTQTGLANIYMPSDETNFNQIYLSADANTALNSSTYPLALSANNGSSNADSYVQLDAEL